MRERGEEVEQRSGKNRRFHLTRSAKRFLIGHVIIFTICDRSCEIFTPSALFVIGHATK